MDGIVTESGVSNGNQGPDFAHLDALKRQIMMLVHYAPPTNEGIHVQTIAQSINASSGTVLQAVEQLSTDGLLYTTIDDDHVNLPIHNL